MAKSKLYLIGTVHVDLEGKQRLTTALEDLEPRSIGLEFHQDMIHMRKRPMTKSKVKKEIEAIIDESGFPLSPSQRRTFIEANILINTASGFEYLVTTEYTRRNPSCKLEYIDLSILGGNKELIIKSTTNALKSFLSQAAEDPESIGPLLEILEGGMGSYLAFHANMISNLYENAELFSKRYEMIKAQLKSISEEEKNKLPQDVLKLAQEIYNPERDEYMSAKLRQLHSQSKREKVVGVVGLAHLAALEDKLMDLKPIVYKLG